MLNIQRNKSKNRIFSNISIVDDNKNNKILKDINENNTSNITTVIYNKPSLKENYIMMTSNYYDDSYDKGIKNIYIINIYLRLL